MKRLILSIIFILAATCAYADWKIPVSVTSKANEKISITITEAAKPDPEKQADPKTVDEVLQRFQKEYKADTSKAKFYNEMKAAIKEDQIMALYKELNELVLQRQEATNLYMLLDMLIRTADLTKIATPEEPF
jgi:hypothetical protein